MNVSNDSYSGDVSSVEKGNKNLESNLRKFKNLWVRRECYLHTLSQAEELSVVGVQLQHLWPAQVTRKDVLVQVRAVAQEGVGEPRRDALY